jgi:replication factor C large subunit
MSEKVGKPWVEKYRPKITKEMVGFKKNIAVIKSFLNNFASKSKLGNLAIKDKAILLEGPPGVGKTTVVYAIAKDLGYTIMEMNASDVRTEGAIKKKLNETVSSKNLMAWMPPQKQDKAVTQTQSLKKIVFIDEVDGISGQSDRGGVAALIKVIEKSKLPIILTANFYETKLKTLYNKIEKINCQRLRTPSIINLLMRIVEHEGINIKEGALKQIAENSEGDLRSAINDLQGLAKGADILDNNEINSIDMHRDTQTKMFDFINKMLDKNTLLDARNVANNTDLDYNIMHKVIYANLPSFVKDPAELSKALINLAKADEIMGKIKKNMDFSLLPYFFDLVSGGVALSIDNPNLRGYKKFKFPRLTNSRMKFVDDPSAVEIQKRFFVSRRDSILKKMQSIKDVISTLPADEIKEYKVKLANELGISPKDL